MRRSEVPFAAEAVNDTSVLSGIRNQFGLSGTSRRFSSMQTQQPFLGWWEAAHLAASRSLWLYGRTPLALPRARRRSAAAPGAAPADTGGGEWSAAAPGAAPAETEWSAAAPGAAPAETGGGGYDRSPPPLQLSTPGRHVYE